MKVGWGGGGRLGFGEDHISVRGGGKGLAENNTVGKKLRWGGARQPLPTRGPCIVAIAVSVKRLTNFCLAPMLNSVGKISVFIDFLSFFSG